MNIYDRFTPKTTWEQWQLENYGNVLPEVITLPDGSIMGQPTKEAINRQCEFHVLNMYTQEPQDCQEVKEQEEYEAEERMNNYAENDLYERGY